jgi:hypothetical protein
MYDVHMNNKNPTTVDAPEGLTDREFHAFRAGLLSFAIRAHEDEMMKDPWPGVIRESFTNELAFRLNELKED